MIHDSHLSGAELKLNHIRMFIKDKNDCYK